MPIAWRAAALKSRWSQSVSLADVSLVPADPMLSRYYLRLGRTEWMRHINLVTNRHSAPHSYSVPLSASQALRHCDSPHTQQHKCRNKSTTDCITSYSKEVLFNCRWGACHVISCVIYLFMYLYLGRLQLKHVKILLLFPCICPHLTSPDELNYFSQGCGIGTQNFRLRFLHF
jgi:hypothetical protein